MFVLGIDPGVSRCGYGCVERSGAALRAIAAGVVTTSPQDPLPERLAGLEEELRDLVAELRPAAVAVETVFFQSNARTAMSVGQASGLALAAAASAGCQVFQYTPTEVKRAVAGHGSAGKEEVERMVATLLSLGDGRIAPDAADALGLAICHLSVSRWEESVARAERSQLRRRPAGAARGALASEPAAPQRGAAL